VQAPGAGNVPEGEALGIADVDQLRALFHELAGLVRVDVLEGIGHDWLLNRRHRCWMPEASREVGVCGVAGAASWLGAFGCSLLRFWQVQRCSSPVSTLSSVRAPPQTQPVSSAWTPGSSQRPSRAAQDRKSTRLNSSHVKISYAVFC